MRDHMTMEDIEVLALQTRHIQIYIYIYICIIVDIGIH